MGGRLRLPGVRPATRGTAALAGLSALILLVVPGQMGVRTPAGAAQVAAAPLPIVDTGWRTNAERVLTTVDDHLALIAKAEKSYDTFPAKRRTAELRGWMERLDANAGELRRIKAAIGPALETVRGYERQRTRLAELRTQLVAAVRARESLERMPESARRAAGVRMRELQNQIDSLGRSRSTQEGVARAWGTEAVAATRTRTLQPAPDTPDLVAKVLRITEPKKEPGAGRDGAHPQGDVNGRPADDGDERRRPALTSVTGLTGGTRVLMAQEDQISKPISEVRAGDPVIVTDLATGDPTIATVRGVSRRTAWITPIKITTRGGTFTAGPAQRLLDHESRRWVTAATLDSGDTLTSLVPPDAGRCAQTDPPPDGCDHGPHPLPIDAVSRGAAATVTVYALSVSGEHNFYVGGLYGPALVQ
ncbi:MAG: hypothetical protein GEV11_23630 [Streptosporangiales bacterium]|nr:hypothetical protein [Streptosporangiales bacterium]